MLEDMVISPDYIQPIYIAEIAPAVIRGRLIGFHECGWQVGTIVGFFINYGVALHVPPGNQQWIIPFAVQLVPAGLLTIVIPFVYESPRWCEYRLC
jgi:MFS family permease